MTKLKLTRCGNVNTRRKIINLYYLNNAKIIPTVVLASFSHVYVPMSVYAIDYNSVTWEYALNNLSKIKVLHGKSNKIHFFKS